MNPLIIQGYRIAKYVAGPVHSARFDEDAADGLTDVRNVSDLGATFGKMKPLASKITKLHKAIQ